MPQDQDDIKGADAMKQAPTPGPLSGDDVKLLVKGDLLRDEYGQLFRFTNQLDETDISVQRPDGDPSRYIVTPIASLIFIGRPAADVWIPWSGGENPVPGQRVEVRFRNDASLLGLSDIWPSLWKHHNHDINDIIAFRLAPTAPVEASADDRWTNEEIEDLISDAIGDSMEMDWTYRDGAKAVLAALHKEGFLRFDLPLAPVEASGSERERLAKCIHRAIGYAWIGEHQAEVAADAVLALQLQLNREQK